MVMPGFGYGLRMAGGGWEVMEADITADLSCVPYNHGGYSRQLNTRGIDQAQYPMA